MPRGLGRRWEGRASSAGPPPTTGRSSSWPFPARAGSSSSQAERREREVRRSKPRSTTISGASLAGRAFSASPPGMPPVPSLREKSKRSGGATALRLVDRSPARLEDPALPFKFFFNLAPPATVQALRTEARILGRDAPWRVWRDRPHPDEHQSLVLFHIRRELAPFSPRTTLPPLSRQNASGS